MASNQRRFHACSVPHEFVEMWKFNILRQKQHLKFSGNLECLRKKQHLKFREILVYLRQKQLQSGGNLAYLRQKQDLKCSGNLVFKAETISAI